MHPTCLIFISLSMLLIIPNYPYYVTFFYTGLGIFFTCLLGRENNDIEYMLLLPIKKTDVVKSRLMFAVILELIQIIFAIPFAILRQKIISEGNQVGMDANIALFGLSFIMLGFFNYIFFVNYYKNTYKVGVAFVKASIFMFIYMGVAETLTHIIPFMKNKLDTPDSQFVAEKLIVLAVGIIIFCTLTFAAYKKSKKLFDNEDI